jgi:putative holliday junction resolvase
MRILGIDYGEKRIGLAITDRQNSLALPFGMIENNDALSENILKLIKDNDIGKIVIGRPVNLKGESGHQAEVVDIFISNILKKFELPISVMDERFTSKISDDLIFGKHNMQKGERNKKQNIKMPKKKSFPSRNSGATDTMSAVLILGDYLNLLKIQESKNEP